MPVELRWDCSSGTCLTLWHITEQHSELAQKYNQIWGEHADSETAKNSSAHKLSARNLIGTEFPGHTLEFSTQGKPLLSPASAHINHSHAGDYAILAQHPNRSVGVDIEQLRPQLQRIYPRFCNETEMLAFGPSPALETLLLLWCAKEALYKAIGEKGTDFREHLHILSVPNPAEVSEGSMTAEISLQGFEQTCELHFRLWDNYAAVWVAIV
jgi:4'-phosphopantetheinyl transferase